jgi:hypothetical protein
MNRYQKNDCVICGGSYSSLNKSTHMKTKKHLACIAVDEKVKIETIDEVFMKLYLNLSDEQKQNMINNMLNPEPKPDIEKNDTDTSDYERYLEIKCKDNKTLEELELYLSHHKIDGMLLTDTQKDFMRSIN